MSQMETTRRQETRGRCDVLSACLLLTDVLGLCALSAAIFSSLPQIRTLASAEPELLAKLTPLFLCLSPVGWCAILGLTAAGLTTKELLVRSSRLRLRINVLAFLLATVFYILYLHAIMAPMGKKIIPHPM